MIFSQLYGGNLDIELGTPDRTQLFTTARRKDAVNDGMRTFVRHTGCTQKYGEIDLTDGTAEYNIFAFLTDYLWLAGDPSVKKQSGGKTTYIQGPKDFPRRNPEQLDHLEPGWRAASAGTPASWYLRKHLGQLLVGLYPPPDITLGDVWDLLVPYVAKPTTMSADASEPFTVGGAVLIDLEYYHQALVHYAAAVLEPLRKNYTGAQRQMQLYTSYVAQYLQQERQSGQNQIMLLRDYLGEGLSSTRALDPRRYP